MSDEKEETASGKPCHHETTLSSEMQAFKLGEGKHLGSYYAARPDWHTPMYSSALIQNSAERRTPRLGPSLALPTLTPSPYPLSHLVSRIDD